MKLGSQQAVTLNATPAVDVLCQAFQALAIDTWDRLGAAARANMRYGEETITDNVLLGLMTSCPSKITCRSFTKFEEARNGADWEWWFAYRSRGLPCRVQAKRLYPPSSYQSLHFKSRSGHRAQIDTLIARAKAQRFVPLYCFFSNLQGTAWPTSIHGVSDDRLWGCATAPARRVKRYGRKDLNGIAGISKPWHLLVCGRDSGRSPLKWIASVLDELEDSSDSLGEHAAASSADLIRELPDYIRAIREMGSDRATEELPPKFPSEQWPRGVLIIEMGND